MKHPDHHIDVEISTKGCACPEFDHKVEKKVMSCKILGSPGLRWYFIFSIDTLGPTDTTLATYYVILFYLEGKIVDGPRVVNRRLPSQASSICPDFFGDTELYFFARSIVPRRTSGYIESKNWLIDVQVFECDEQFLEAPKSPLAAARTMLNRKGKINPPRLQRTCNFDSQRLIVHYKFEYRCADLLPSCPKWEDVWDSSSEEDFGKDSNRTHIPGQSIINFKTGKDLLNDNLEPPPEYSWGPQPKSPPSWEQKLIGGDFLGWKNAPKQGVLRNRSPLGKIVSGVEGLSIRTKKRTALQRVPRPTKPIIPKFPRQRGDHMPPGWEVRYTDTYRTYYVNHKHKYTTWQHPLRPGSVPVPQNTSKGFGKSPPERLPMKPSPKPLPDKPDMPNIVQGDNEGKEGPNDKSNQEMVINSAGEVNLTLIDKLKIIDRSIVSLWVEQAKAEAEIQKYWLSDEQNSGWLNTYLVEHWFPREETSEPIIETVSTRVPSDGLYDALQQRVKLMDKMESLVDESSSLEESIERESLLKKANQTTTVNDLVYNDGVENGDELNYALQMPLQVDEVMQDAEDSSLGTRPSREESIFPSPRSILSGESDMKDDDALYAPPPIKYVLLMRSTLVLRGGFGSATARSSEAIDQAMSGFNEIKTVSPQILDIRQMNQVEVVPTNHPSILPVGPTVESSSHLLEGGAAANPRVLPSSRGLIGEPASGFETEISSDGSKRKGRKRRMTDGLGSGESSNLDVYKRGSYGLRKRNRTV